MKKKIAIVVAISMVAVSLSFVTQAKELSLFDTDREALTQQPPEVAFWIWTDKYVYTPGEQITLKGTIKTNGDLNPYTLVVYRQNNQTGVRTYFPNNNTEVTDFYGRTNLDLFGINHLFDATKATIIGPGGSLAFNVTAPNELGMHTWVVEIRDFTGYRVVKTAYFKIGVVSGFETLQGNIEADQTLVNTKAYRLTGVVFVRNNAVLTIEPGTFIIGQPGSQPASSLIVTQTGKIRALGTRSRPIIFTSSLPFGQRKAGDWGGVILLGSAPVNWPTGFGNIEGLTASDDTRYGGNNAAHDCGTLEYVRIEYAGAEFQPNNEINALTFGGCGTGTTVHHVQTRYGLDDMFEWFGGTMDAKYLVGAYARDDYIDVQIGWTGRLQHILAVAGRDVPGNRGFEFDNNELDFGATPNSTPKIFNVTMVGVGDTLTQGSDEGESVAGAWLRRGTGGSFNNIVLFNWIANGFTIRDEATMGAVDRGELTLNGLLMWDNGKASGKTNTLNGQTSGSSNLALPFLSGQRGQARNVLVVNPRMRRPLEFSDPDFRPDLGSPLWRANWVQPPDDGFFDQWARWTGAFGDEDWTEEWTCFHVEADIAP
ncbi:MAG: hypothetical protein AB1898_30665 [Acidobacteriota bacterium]